MGGRHGRYHQTIETRNGAPRYQRQLSRDVRLLPIGRLRLLYRKAFFPLENEYASLLLTFVVFGAGFLMRPLGAIILGAYVDRIGRRKGLIVTLSIMAAGTVLVAFVPSYATIGIVAPLLVLIGRLLQGFFCRRRTGWRFGLPCGNGNARQKGLLRELAIGKPASRHHCLSLTGLRLEFVAWAGASG